MSTVPTPRVDKNGNTVTRHMNPDKGESKGGERVAGVTTPPVSRAAPDSFSGEDDSPLASEYVGEFLDGGQYSSDPVYARADYAEVREDGIVYGVVIDDSYFGDIFAGAKKDDEDSEDYQDRSRENFAVNWEYLIQPVLDKYGATATENSETGTGIEFFVPYPNGSADSASLEFMGDLVESKTKLLDLNNDFNDGTLQNFLAHHFDYQWVVDESQPGEGYWAEEEVPIEFSYLQGRGQL